MMKVLLLILLSSYFLCYQSGELDPHGWQGIRPLHSTRADVERLFGPSKSECRCAYDSKDYNITVVYSSGECGGMKSSGWQVPDNTVIRFGVNLKLAPSFSESSIDKREFTKTEHPELPSIFRYFNEKAGLGFDVDRDRIISVYYEPSAGDKDKLRCPSGPRN